MKAYKNVEIEIRIFSENILTQSNDALIQDSFDEFGTRYSEQ